MATIIIKNNNPNTVNGTANDDLIIVGNGNDIINAGAGNDLVSGGGGNDIIDGGAGLDVLSGGAGNDTMNGGAGSDVVSGDDGNDIVNGGAGSDIVSGGAGTDTLVYDITENTGSYDIYTGDGGTDTLVLRIDTSKFNAQPLVDFVASRGGTLPSQYDFKAFGFNLKAYNIEKITLETYQSTPVNAPPDSADKAIGITEDNSYSFAKTDFAFVDPNAGDTLKAVRIDSVPTSGILQMVNGATITAIVAGQLINEADLSKLVFTPLHDMSGSVSFNFSVQDSAGAFDIAPNTMTFNIAPVNDAPVGAATAVLAAGTEDVPYTILQSDLLKGFSDVDSVNLSVQGLTASGIIGGQVVAFTVVQDATGFTITTPADYSGAVNLAYSVSDGALSVGGTQQYQITPINDAPIGSATAALAAGTEDVPYTILQSDLLQGFSDVDSILSVQGLNAIGSADGQPLTFTVVQGADGNFTITTPQNYNGSVNLAYTVNDGQFSLAGDQHYVITPVNDAPTGVATAILPNGIEDTSYAIFPNVLLQGFSDIDSPSLSVVGLTASALISGQTVNFGVTQGIGGVFFITPAQDYNGVVNVAYNVSDGELSIAAAQQFSLSAANDAPRGAATAALPHGLEDTSYNVTPASLLQGFSDVDSTILKVQGVTASAVVDGQALNLTVINNPNGSFNIVAPTNYNGDVSIAYKVTDGQLSISGGQQYHIDAVNDAPTGAATFKFASGVEDIPSTLLQSDLIKGFSDIDGDPLQALSLKATGFVNNINTAFNVQQDIDGNFVVTTTPNFNGSVNITYVVSDGQAIAAGSDSYSVSAVNDDPTGQLVFNDTTPVRGEKITVDASQIQDVDGIISPISFRWVKVDTLGHESGSVSLSNSYQTTFLDTNSILKVYASYTDGDGTHEIVTGQTDPIAIA